MELGRSGREIPLLLQQVKGDRHLVAQMHIPHEEVICRRAQTGICISMWPLLRSAKRRPVQVASRWLHPSFSFRTFFGFSLIGGSSSFPGISCNDCATLTIAFPFLVNSTRCLSHSSFEVRLSIF